MATKGSEYEKRQDWNATIFDVTPAQAPMVANTLNVEMGGRSTVVAGGMDSTTAYGLMTDVSKVLGFK
jgi:hypothetical protein